MASLKENADTKVSTTTSVDMKTAASVTLFNVPAGKTFHCTKVVIRGNSASLAGGTSYAFTDWRSGIDLSGMTVTTGARQLRMTDNTTYTPVAGGSPFQIIVTTGSTDPCTATIDVFGYLV